MRLNEQKNKQADPQILEEEIRHCVEFENFREQLLRRSPDLDCLQVATAWQKIPHSLTFMFGDVALTQADYDKVDEFIAPDKGLRNISKIAQLRNLECLDLSNNPIQDFSPLVRLENLKYLYLEKTGIQDLSVLAGLKNLKVLSLADNPFTDYSPLHGLSRLEELDIQLCELNLDALEELGMALSQSEIIHHYYRFDDDWD